MLSHLRSVLCGLICVVTCNCGNASEAGLRTLYLIRHGIYDPTPAADDRTGNNLNALGREQAGFVAERLAGLPIQFTTVVSSEFARAKETADIIASRLRLECERSPLLNETIAAGIGIPATRVDPGSDEQLNAAWEHFFRPRAAGEASTHEVLVCHSIVIRWLVCRALGVNPASWPQMEIANGSLTILQVRPDGTVRLQVFNDTAHVPLAKQTWSGRGPDWPLPAQPRRR